MWRMAPKYKEKVKASWGKKQEEGICFKQVEKGVTDYKQGKFWRHRG